MLEIILSTVRPFPLLTGKVLAAGLLGFIQVVVWGLCAAFAMSRLAAVVPAMSQLTVEPGLVVWMVVYFIAGYCMFAGAYASIGALSQSMREGPQMVAVITLPAMLPFYFISVIAEWPNAALPVAMSLFPITAPIGMIQRLAVTDVPPIEIAISLTLVLLTAVGLLWLAARLFRVQTLLAGQAPRWRDILRIVRET